jgi:hypothetical protein
VGPLIIPEVKCVTCGFSYNGKTGGPIGTAIAVYLIVVLGFFVVLAAVSVFLLITIAWPRPRFESITHDMDWCLVTDIDGTLIGESESTEELRRVVLEARTTLARAGARLRWVVATGRTHASTCEVLLESGFRLDDFDALITSVGAELYLTGETGPHGAYHARLRSTGFEAARVRECLDRLGELELQPEHEQFPYKVCYFAKEDPALRQRVLAALGELPFKTTTVFALGDYLEHGRSLDQFLDDFPSVDRTQAIAVLEQAGDLLIQHASAA